ncbi:hypothetical protein ACFYY5_29430 [Nocardia elegans]|uniref:Phosphoribosyl-ATP pyrophosphohydrolase n=1 Tax=Nocardia elegans TaxID=300029 RepID=A0ABW6TPV0_9NOCA
MTDIWADVARFNRACDVRLRDLPGWVPDDELDLALALVAEELGELDSALEQRDLVDTADAIADSVYVLVGLALRLCIGRRYITDIVKDAPAGYIGFDGVAGFEIEVVREDLAASHARLLFAIENRSLPATDSAVHHLLFGVAGVGFMLGLPMEAVWVCVHASNMTKTVDGKVIRNASGKIMKPDTFIPPAIGEVLRRHGWGVAA